MKKFALHVFLVLCLAFSFSGCETVKTIWGGTTTGYNLSASGTAGIVNDDTIVVRTEQALKISLDTFDTLLKLEYENKVLFSKIPGAHKFCERVRLHGKEWIKAAERAHDAYKGNRNASNYATLATAYKTLQSAITESQQLISNNSKKI